MRRDPPQFAEEVEDKATLSSFFSGLPGGGSDEGSNHAVDESGGILSDNPYVIDRFGFHR